MWFEPGVGGDEARADDVTVVMKVTQIMVRMVRATRGYRDYHECGSSAGCRRYTRQKYLQVRHPRIRITPGKRIQPALDHGFQNFAGTCVPAGHPLLTIAPENSILL